jgi:hypothetical protein
MMGNVNSPRLQPKFRLHPLIHSFGSREDTATCGGVSERARVGIKVCNSQSGWRVGRASRRRCQEISTIKAFDLLRFPLAKTNFDWESVGGPGHPKKGNLKATRI